MAKSKDAEQSEATINVEQREPTLREQRRAEAAAQAAKDRDES